MSTNLYIFLFYSGYLYPRRMTIVLFSIEMLHETRLIFVNIYFISFTYVTDYSKDNFKLIWFI